MCGILVIVDPAADQSESGFLEQLKLLEPRGPDERWHLRAGGVVAGFTRLSLFASEASIGEANPDDESVLILLNGEIWNYAELRSQFDGPIRSEYELIRTGYLRHGIDFVSRLDGMFFLAILDRRNGELFFARDPVGIKPAFFFCSEDRKSLMFASDVKPICAHPGIDLRINENYLVNQSVFSYSDYEDNLVAGVRQIPPGHFIHAALRDNDRIELQLKTFDSHISQSVQQDADPIAAQLHILEQAIDKRCRHRDSSAVGLLLSGGIDSSLIAFVARRLGLDDLICFYLGDRDTEDHRWASWVAEQNGYRLEHVQPRSADMLRSMPWYCYELSGEKGFVACVLASEIRRSHPEIKIVLCGEGSDELYAGYYWYLNTRHTIDTIRTRLTSRTPVTALIHRFDTLMRGAQDASDELERLIAFLQGPQLVNNHLLQLDHGFMAKGIELRVPFLDLANVSFARSLPIERKVHANRTKTILKDVMSTAFLVPDRFLERRKTGFPSSLPPSMIDMQSFAEAIVPSQWRENHRWRRHFQTAFDMMWFDLSCLVLFQRGRPSPESVAITQMYLPDNIEAMQGVVS